MYDKGTTADDSGSDCEELVRPPPGTWTVHWTNNEEFSHKQGQSKEGRDRFFMLNDEPAKECSCQVSVGVEEHIVARQQVIVIQIELLRTLCEGDELTYCYVKPKKKKKKPKAKPEKKAKSITSK